MVDLKKMIGNSKSTDKLIVVRDIIGLVADHARLERITVDWKDVDVNYSGEDKIPCPTIEILFLDGTKIKETIVSEQQKENVSDKVRHHVLEMEEDTDAERPDLSE